MVLRGVLMRSGLVSINIARQMFSKTVVSVNTTRQVNTAHSKTTVNAARPMINTAKPKAVVNVVKGNIVHAVKASACWVQVSDGLGPQKKLIFLPHVQGNLQMDLHDKGVIDSGCSRHMTGNMSYLTDYEEIDRGNVAFRGNLKGGKITGKGMRYRASCKSKTENSLTLPLHFLHMDLFGPTFVKRLMKKIYCLVVIDDYSRFTWVFFLATKDETSGILKSFIIGIKNLVDYKVKVIRCDNGTEFKNREMNQFCEMKGNLRQYSVARTPQQNTVTERRNRTLIEAARTMLPDSKLPTTFWAEAVSNSCYVQNRVLVVKPHNKTPYELFHGRTLALSFMKPFGCPVTILNTKDHLGKFDGKDDEGFFVGYSLNSKAFRVFNSRTRIVEENLHIREETEPAKDYILLPLWRADILFSHHPKSSHDDGFKPSSDDGKKVDEDPSKDSECNDQEKEDNVNSTNNVNAAGISEVNVVGAKSSIELLFDPYMLALEDISTFNFSSDHEDDDALAHMNNLDTTIQVSPTPTTRIHKDHPLDQVIGDVQLAVQIRNMSKDLEEHMKNPKRNKKDKWEIVIRNKARLVAQGHTQEEGINYDEVFTLLKIIEEVYVCQLLGFEDPDFPDRLYKVKKALYGLHRAPRAWFKEVKTASTPMETQKPLLKDEDGEELDVHMYRYLKGQPKLGLWYPKDSSFYLVAYTDSDYVGSSLDKKSTTRGCQYLESRLISWQCKKQVVIVNSTTEAKYVAASRCCGQLLRVLNINTTVMPITSAEDKAQRRLEVKARSTLMMGIPNEHQLKFNSIKDSKQLLEDVKNSDMLDQTFDRLQKLVSQLELLGEKLSTEDVNQKLLRSLSPEWNTHAVVWRNKTNLDSVSMDDLYNNLKVFALEVKGITQVNAAFSSNIDNSSDAIICTFLASQPNSPQLAHEDLEQIYPDDIKEIDLRCRWPLLQLPQRGHFDRECKALRNQDYKNKESLRRSVHVETPTSSALVLCDGLGGYDWSDQAEQGPNYTLMAYSSSSYDSKVSNDSTCLASIAERLEFFKTNESIYLEDIKGLRVDIQLKEIAIRELRKMLEIAQKEKDGIQLKVDKFENASKILPPYTGKFRPPTPDLSFTGLYEFVNKSVAENCKAKTSKEEPMIVRKNDDALIIKEWVSDNETPALSFMKPFGCPVTILNTKDHLGKFDGKADEGFFVGYSLNSISFRVFNSRTRIVEENLHIRFSENTPNIDGTKANDNTCQARKETEPVKDYIFLPLWIADPLFSHRPKSSHDDGFKPSSDNGKKVDEDPRKDSECDDQEKKDNVNNTNNVNVVGTNEVNVVGAKSSIELLFDLDMPALEDISRFNFSSDHEDDDALADMDNLDTTIQEEPKKVIHALKDPSLIKAMLEELLQFKLKEIEKEVYVCQPPGFEYPDFPDRLCKVEKALYELHKAPRAWHKGDILLVQVYVDDIIFGSTKNQDKYVGEILKKFWYKEVKTVSTPMETQKSLLKDEAYTDSDYAGASLDRKSTTRGCQYLRSRLISWQCKKQTVIVNSTIEVKYVDALSCLDGKEIVITESSVRKDLRLAYEEGIDCLPNSTIFENLKLMGPKTTTWNELSSTMTSAIIYLAINQEFNFSKLIFDSMIRNLDNVSGKILMYPSMLVQNPMGEGLAMPTDPQHTPTILESSSSQPQKTQKPRKPKRKDTKVPQPSDPVDIVVDEVVHKQRGGRLVRAATTTSSLEAE
ncbi:retrovirus-related pol polyprotein from transposon TNT 1-94 [Tanacetum coccineum]